MSQLRMQTQVPAAKADSRFSLDPILLDEIRQVSCPQYSTVYSMRIIYDNVPR